MNILGVVDSASSLFSKKIRVTLIHSETGEKLTTEMLDSSQLPKKFDRPTILEIDNTQWRVVKFEQLSSQSYFRSAHICLHVISPDQFISNGRYLIPTHASINRIKTTKENSPLSEDFTVSITQEEWLQLEFLAFENLVHIQEITSRINEVINPADGSNNLLGYASSHRRDTIDHYQIEISLDEFEKFLHTSTIGNLILADNSFIEQGFSIRSENHTYYGIVNQGLIRKLGVKKFESIDEELSNVLLKYNLVFVDWRNANILSP